MRKFSMVLICLLVIQRMVFSHSVTGFYGISEKNGSFLPDTVWLLNEDSVLVNVVDLIDKPTVLSFVYFKCPGLCSPLMNGLAELIDRSEIQIGTHYQIITISIDHQEMPSVASSKKNAYLRTMKKAADAAESWKFLTGDSINIQILTNAAGWQFKRNKEGFIHAAAVILVTPDRMISQYLYGIFFMPVHFQLAVSDAWKGLSVPSRIKTLKYCYDYAVKTNRRVRTVAFVFGICIILAVAGLFIRLLIKQPVRDSVSDN